MNFNANVYFSGVSHKTVKYRQGNVAWSAKWTVSVSLPVAVSVANIYEPKLVHVILK